MTSFGGPIAHLAYFREEFVARRRWLSEESYAQIIALCQFLPGPASSQVGMTIGYERAGMLGAIAAWCGFTLPSAFALVAFAYGLRAVPHASSSGWVHGLLIAALAVVALAVANMAASLAPDRLRRTLAVGVAIVTLSVPPNGYTQALLVAFGAFAGRLFLTTAAALPSTSARRPLRYGKRHVTTIAIASAIAFLLLVTGLPVAAQHERFGPFVAFARFFEVGALVFGGGHVVLPLLQAQVVTPGWISSETFLTGYGAAQAVPGPLFTFAAFLGAAMERGPVHGIGGATLCLFAIYLPSFLLVAAVLPFWSRFAGNAAAAAAVRGANAAVVGLLLAALYNPVWITAITSTGDVALTLVAVLALQTWRAPPWAVVLGSALVAETLHL